MATIKVAVTIEERLLRSLDRRVAAGAFASRSEAVRAGVELLLNQEGRATSLLAALVELDPREEQELADEILDGEVW